MYNYKPEMAQHADRTLDQKMKEYFLMRTDLRYKPTNGVNNIRNLLCPDLRTNKTTKKKSGKFNGGKEFIEYVKYDRNGNLVPGQKPTPDQTKYSETLRTLYRGGPEARVLKNRMVDEAKRYAQFLLNFTYPDVHFTYKHPEVDGIEDMIENMGVVRNAPLHPSAWGRTQHKACHIFTSDDNKVSKASCNALPGLQTEWNYAARDYHKIKKFIPLLYHIIYDYGVVENILGKKYYDETTNTMKKFGEYDIRRHVEISLDLVRRGQKTIQESKKEIEKIVLLLDYVIFLREFDRIYCPYILKDGRKKLDYGQDFISIITRARDYCLHELSRLS